MPNQIEAKAVDYEAELSREVALFQRLAPACSVAKRAQGTPQLAPQEKQLGILSNELKEAMLCISLAQKGLHAVRDGRAKREMKKNIVEYERAIVMLRSETKQQGELDCLNYLTQKQLENLKKVVPQEAAEIIMINQAENRLRQMENRLEIATRRFSFACMEVIDMRNEIKRLLGERNKFNLQWNNTIQKLVKGKEYLMDILEIATNTFGDRDECCKMLEAVKWKGLFQLNKDIATMQAIEGELNHLAKLEEFLRVKGSKRVCEADERRLLALEEEHARCEQQIAALDELMEKIFEYAETEHQRTIIRHFRAREINNFSIFTLLCEILQETIFLKKDLEFNRSRTVDQREINKRREEAQQDRLSRMRTEVAVSNEKIANLKSANEIADITIQKVMKEVTEIIALTKSDVSPLLRLLGNHKEVTKWNVSKFLKVLEIEVKSIVEVVYDTVKPPAPTPRGKQPPPPPQEKLVGDPRVPRLLPNPLDMLIPYYPCAYCVEDYMMNQVYEVPAQPADRAYVERMFHLEDINTKFGIFTLTIPTKRHPFRAAK